MIYILRNYKCGKKLKLVSLMMLVTRDYKWISTLMARLNSNACTWSIRQWLLLILNLEKNWLSVATKLIERAHPRWPSEVKENGLFSLNMLVFCIHQKILIQCPTCTFIWLWKVSVYQSKLIMRAALFNNSRKVWRLLKQRV